MPSSLRSPAHQALIARLKQARKAAGLRQAEVAQRLGVPQSYVAKVEGGERRLEVLEFIRLAKVLDLDPAQLVAEVASVPLVQDVPSGQVAAGERTA